MARRLLLAALAAVAGADAVALASAEAQPGMMPPMMPGMTPNVDISVMKATEQAKLAWAMAKKLEKQAEENKKVPPLVKAEVALARTAAETAGEEDLKLEGMVNKARKDAKKVAMEAAEGFYAQVKAAGAAGAAEAQAARDAADDGVEVRTAQAAVKAAMPYHAMLLRGQKVVVDYANTARALAAASNNLKIEGAALASNAEQYQAVGEWNKAATVMATAHQLMKQGQMMSAQAKALQSDAAQVQASLPLYHAAEQSAASVAAAEANPAVLPQNGPRPY
jgi:hypothetical protein